MVTHRRARPVLALCLAVLLAASACGGTDEGEGATTSETGGDASLAPDIDDHVAWIVELLNGATASEDEVADRFNEAFLAQVPPAAFLDVTEQLRAEVATIWTPVATTEPSERSRVVVLELGGVPPGAGPGEPEPWELAVEVDGDGLMGTAFLSPQTPPGLAEVASYDEVVATATDLVGPSGRVALMVAEIVDRSCEVVHDTGADEVVPIGSTFKLYVLGAVAAAVDGGDVAWDDPLPIQDELKSLPSGTFQDLPAGTEQSVLDHATAMISVSDNTATDHLIDLVGREAIEDLLEAFGNSVPDRNRPFLTTAELFALKLQIDDQERSDYLGLDEDGRRRFLDELGPLTVGVDDPAVGAWSDPVAVDELEWFATPLDQCRVLAALAGPGSDEVRTILSVNPGAPVDPVVLPFVAFKGGSEPGVLNLAWLVERADGRTFAVVGNVTNPDAPVAEAQVAPVLSAALGLVANEE